MLMMKRKKEECIMKKLMIITASLLLAGGAAFGVAAAGKETTQVDETAVTAANVTKNDPVSKEENNKKQEQISTKEAEKIALEYVGMGKVDDIELERKQGRLAYEVDVDLLGEDGDVYVDAVTGEVLAVDGDLLKQRNKQSNSEVQVTAEKAIAIAFEHVGEGEVDDLDLKRENGRFVYEIEIEQTNDKEVDLMIDAENGDILFVKWDD